MKPLVVGTREDVAGFALAGIEGIVCTTAEEARRALAGAGQDTLVIVSPNLWSDGRFGRRASPMAEAAVAPLSIVLP